MVTSSICTRKSLTLIRANWQKEIAGVKYYNPMMIYPAIHYTMGGIWVDYELMTSIKGLFAIGECNFSDHGANRLGASALMQGSG